MTLLAWVVFLSIPSSPPVHTCLSQIDPAHLQRSPSQRSQSNAMMRGSNCPVQQGTNLNIPQEL